MDRYNLFTFVSLNFLLVAIIILSASCDSTNSKNIPKTDNKQLNKLISRAPSTSIINLRKHSVDSLLATEKNIMGDKSASSFSPPAQLGRVVGLITVQDNLYAADQQQACIWKLNKDGKIEEKIGRRGKGPGEFGMIAGLYKNSDKIFTADASNMQLSTFNNAFNVVSSFQHRIVGNNLTGNNSIAVSDELLFVPANDEISDKLIEVRKESTPFDSVGTFVPRIIPPGKQPKSYNNYVADVSSSGEAVVAYTGLPYIFLFDSQQHLQRVIYLELPTDRLPDNPSASPVEKDQAMGVKGLVTKLHLTAEGMLYFDVGKYLYQLSPSPDKTSYNLKKVRFFTFSDSQKRKENPIGINATTMAINDDTIYLGSIYKKLIYRFDL